LGFDEEGLRLRASDLDPVSAAEGLEPGAYALFLDPPGARDSRWISLEVRALDPIAAGVVAGGELVSTRLPGVLDSLLRLQCRSAGNGPWQAQLEDCSGTIDATGRSRVFLRLVGRGDVEAAFASEPVPVWLARTAPVTAPTVASGLDQPRLERRSLGNLDWLAIGLTLLGMAGLQTFVLFALKRRLAAQERLLRGIAEGVRGLSAAQIQSPPPTAPRAVREGALAPERSEAEIRKLFSLVQGISGDLRAVRKQLEATEPPPPQVASASSLTLGALLEAPAAPDLAHPGLRSLPGSGSRPLSDDDLAAAAASIYPVVEGTVDLEERWRAFFESRVGERASVTRGGGDLSALLLAEAGDLVIGVPGVLAIGQLSNARDRAGEAPFEIAHPEWAVGSQIAGLIRPARFRRADGGLELVTKGLVDFRPERAEA